MRNPFLGWNTDALATTKGWFGDIEQTLASLLQRCQATRIEVVDARVLLDRLEDALGDCRGAIHQLAEAQHEASKDAQGYAQAVGQALRAAG